MIAGAYDLRCSAVYLHDSVYSPVDLRCYATLIRYVDRWTLLLLRLLRLLIVVTLGRTVDLCHRCHSYGDC